ncbi:MAG: molybdenum cofactor guanylyltransferase [Actinomycetes bacterium]
MTIPALLLTGGASRRMGTPKAAIEVDGETLAVRTARVLTSVCDPVIEVGPGYTELPVVREDPPGEGPLAAFVAGSAHLSAGIPILMVACDLPDLDPTLLRVLAEHPGTGGVIPESEGRLQTLCARYGVEARRVAPELLATGARSLRALLDASEHEVLLEDAWSRMVTADTFHDLDTPEDLARFRSTRATGSDAVR